MNKNTFILSGWVNKVLIGLIIAFIVCRFVAVEHIPSILNRDEAALAYNALLLQKTGTDEWGRSWPLTLESFGDYKLPGFVVTLVGLFSVFGYHDWVVKVPSLLAGVGVLLVSYFFCKKYWNWVEPFSLLPLVLIALTPIFFFYSRIGFEAHLALAFLLLSLSIWWMPVKETKTKNYLLFSTIATTSYALSCLTYNTPLLLLPVLIGSTMWRQGLFEWKKWALPVLMMTLVAGIVAFQLLPLTKQKSAITVFADPTIHDQWVTQRENLPSWAKPLLGKKFVFIATKVGGNFISTLTPSFLVTKGGAHPWHQVPNGAHLTWGLYILGWLGFGLVLFTKKENKAILLLGIGSLLPAIVTTDAPHATRSLLFLWVWIMLAARGLVAVFSYLGKAKKKQIQWLSYALLCLLILEFSLYIRTYWDQYSRSSQTSLKTGFGAVIQELEKKETGPVAIVDSEGYHYILAAWYAKMDPTTFFSTQIRQQPNSIGFRYGEKVGKYHFIASPMDRVPSEDVLVQWNGSTWSVENE